MADEKEEILISEIADLEEQIKVLAVKIEELMGVDCEFGACILDPSLDTAEKKLEEIQRRKKNLEGILKSLEQCEA